MNAIRLLKFLINEVSSLLGKTLTAVEPVALMCADGSGNETFGAGEEVRIIKDIGGTHYKVMGPDGSQYIVSQNIAKKAFSGFSSPMPMRRSAANIRGLRRA